MRLELGPPGRIPLKSSSQAMISTQIQIRFLIPSLPGLALSDLTREVVTS